MSRRGPRLLSLAGAALAAFGVWLSMPGVQPLAPPATAADCEQVWVLSNGFHSSLTLPPQAAAAVGLSAGAAPWVEIGWGEARAYQSETMDPITLLRAAVAPGETTLFVALIGFDPGRYGADQAQPVAVSRAGLRVLLADVAAEVRRDAAGRPRILSTSATGTFLAAHSPFGPLRPCNVWVAERLRRAGVPIRDRAALTATGLFSALQREAPARCPMPVA